MPDIIFYILTGQDGEIIPRNATHVGVHKSVTVIPAFAFYEHPNIVEFICHNGVERIASHAFTRCPRLKRLIMRGVKSVEDCAFHSCTAITHVECRELERIGAWAFHGCKALTDIDLPSIKVVEEAAFNDCRALRDVTFGRHLAIIRWAAFNYCRALERITIPLNDGLITADNIFQGCANLKHIDFFESDVLHDTIDALQLQDWRNDMKKEIDSINQILLPSTSTSTAAAASDRGLVQAIRGWIARVLCKLIGYKAQHGRLLQEAAAALKAGNRVLEDNVRRDVLPFLALPVYRFEGEDYGEDESEGGELVDEGRKRRKMLNEGRTRGR